MTDIATLGLKVDSSQVKESRQDLDQFTQSAGKAEKAAENLGKSSATAADSIAKNAGALGDVSAELEAMSARVAALRTSGVASAELSAALVGAGVGLAAAAT